jgi:hypothetical protein
MTFELTVVLEQTSLKRGPQPVPKRSVLYFNTNYAKKFKLLWVPIMNHPICNFPQPPVTSSFLRSKFFSAPYSQISSICDLPYGREPVGHAHTKKHLILQRFTKMRTILIYVKTNRNLLHCLCESPAFWLLDPLGREKQVDPRRWLPTKNLRRVTSQKSEGLYSALVHSIECLAIFRWPLSGWYKPDETRYQTVAWIKRTQLLYHFKTPHPQKPSLGRSTRRWTDRTETDLKETGCEDLDWVGVVHYRDNWYSLLIW